MSPKAQIPLSKSATSQARILSTSLTPFLYLTQTLEGQHCNAKFKHPLRRTHKAHRSFCSTSRTLAQANDTPIHNSTSSENTPNAILSVPSEYRIRVPGQSRGEANSPIPEGGDEVSWQQSLIDRICLELSRLPGNQDTAEDDIEYDRRANAYEEIAIIFEKAIREVEFQEEQSAQNLKKNRRLYFENLPQRAIDVSRELGKIPRGALPAKVPLRGAIDKPREPGKIPRHALSAEERLQEAIDEPSDLDNGVPLGDAPSLAGDEFQVERRFHEEHFMRELERAQTDDAVWSVLETKVFSLIKTVQKRNEEGASKRNDQTSSKVATPKKSRRRKGQPEQKETNSISIPSETKAKVEATVQSSPPSPSLSLVPQPPPVTITPEAISSIIQHNYGRYCLTALKVLRRHFPTSPYALRILPTIKQLGPISYVLGATSSLYNELLYLRWTEYADLHGMSDILEEMKNQGVQQDDVTRAVMRVVECEREAQRNNDEVNEGPTGEGLRHQRHHKKTKPENNTANAAWWKLRQVQEGWIRLVDNFHAAEMLREEQRLREAQDEHDMRAVEEAEAKQDANVSRPKKKMDWGTRSPIRRVRSRRKSSLKVG